MTEKLVIGKKEFILGKRAYIMGILNVTPDSFSDGGAHNKLEDALRHTEEMIQDGADLIDIGGESTRPGYEKVSDEEEISRVTKIIERIKFYYDIPISIDTYKSKVAKEALLAGADMVNDIWGLKYEKQMAALIKEFHVPVCIMHNRKSTEYGDFLEEVKRDLFESVQLARAAGIEESKIILDPGIGFAKTLDHNLQMLCSLEQLMELDFPILLGASRKSVIGQALNLPVTEREEGTIAASVIAVMKGCHFLRVHNVKGNARAVRMAEAILNTKNEEKEGI